MSTPRVQAYECVAFSDGVLLFVEEISHRLMNDYARAISELTVAARTVDNPSARYVMLGAAKSLQARAEVHRALQAPLAARDLDIGDYLQEVCTAVSKASLADAGIQLTLSRCSAPLSAARCWRLGLIVFELVNNAARHGLSWASGEIRVELEVAHSELSCTVKDNGHSTASPTAGRGSRIVSALVADLGGRVDWRFGATGASAIVRMPLIANSTHQTRSETRPRRPRT